MEAMGDKIAARKRMIAAGVPVVPGTEQQLQLPSPSKTGGCCLYDNKSLMEKLNIKEKYLKKDVYKRQHPRRGEQPCRICLYFLSEHYRLRCYPADFRHLG